MNTDPHTQPNKICPDNEPGITPLTPPQGKQIAEILCQASERLLWQHCQTWAYDKKPQTQLHFRVGTGRATYHSVTGNQHIITFGQKMVLDKHNPVRAREWVTYKEIEARQYFSSQPSFTNILAHTCCHEFAHFIQTINGWWRRRSVHNKSFYHILDRLHHSGKAAELETLIIQQHQLHKLPIQFSQSAHHEYSNKQFNIGDNVCFMRQKKLIQGRVKRINQYTLSIYPVDPTDPVLYYRVPPSQVGKILPQD